MVSCNTMRLRGQALGERQIVFPLWLACQMAMAELDRHPVHSAWEIDEYDIEVNAPTPYEAMIGGLI